MKVNLFPGVFRSVGACSVAREISPALHHRCHGIRTVGTADNTACAIEVGDRIAVRIHDLEVLIGF